jgi:hypothetical protein
LLRVAITSRTLPPRPRCTLLHAFVLRVRKSLPVRAATCSSRPVPPRLAAPIKGLPPPLHFVCATITFVHAGKSPPPPLFCSHCGHHGAPFSLPPPLRVGTGALPCPGATPQPARSLSSSLESCRAIIVSVSYRSTAVPLPQSEPKSVRLPLWCTVGLGCSR